MKHTDLIAARTAKKDEFYTQMRDIEKECPHYKEHFRGKTVFCNCNDGIESAFFRYFVANFESLGLKGLMATTYCPGGHGSLLSYDPVLGDAVTTELSGDGDFRSPECLGLLNGADIVVTNPPFSLFKEFVPLMASYGKKILVIGNQNAAACRDVFPLIKENRLWFGYSVHCGDMEFEVPGTYGQESLSYRVEDGRFYVSVPGVRWYTNMSHGLRDKPIALTRKYDPEYYPRYDNYDAIDVSKTCDIPEDYDGPMGVPLTFLDKYCPEQFEIVDARDYALHDRQRNKNTYLIKDKDGTIGGKPKYTRILIRRKK